jgi:DNA-binding MarR family transcriptional regulator
LDSPESAQDNFLDDYLSYLLAQASFLVSNQFHRELERSNISVPFWRVLAAVSDRESLSVGALAKMAFYKQPTLTKIIDRMIEAGLVKRLEYAKDRRRVDIAITDAGRALFKVLMLRAKEHEGQVLASYSATDAATLKHVLRDLIKRLDHR